MVVLVLAGAAEAQPWRGATKLRGVVLDAEEKPIEGAKVELTRDPEGDGPAPVLTNAHGRFTIPNLAQGPWRVVITAEGQVRSEGIAPLGAVGFEQPMRVVMRPLSEVSPSFAENRSSIMGWLQRGDSLLEQGHPEAARAEYEKALGAMPVQTHPPVLRAVARSHLEERHYDLAVAVLEEALALVPTDETSRRHYRELMTALGRQEAAEAHLRALDEAPPPPPPPAPPPPQGIALRLDDGIPADPPRAGRGGAYRVAFEERSPLGDLDVFLARYGLDREAVLADDPQATHYDLANESFEVMAPEVFEGDEPWGLFVWVSPTPRGIARQSFAEVLARHRVLWVGANNAGNPRPAWDRMALALDAAHNMTQLYSIDPDRVWVGGYSGGGRVASALAVLYPEVFRGGLFVHGCNYYRDVSVPSKPGMIWPAGFEPPDRETFKLVRRRNRYVFLTGEHDFNRAQTRELERHYRDDGFRHTTYVEIPNAHHYSGLPADYFDRALDFFDGGR